MNSGTSSSASSSLLLVVILLFQALPLLETFQIPHSYGGWIASRNSQPPVNRIPTASHSRITTYQYASIGGERWNEFMQNQARVLGPATLLSHQQEVQATSATGLAPQNNNNNVFAATKAPQRSVSDPWAPGNPNDLVDPIEHRRKLERHCNIGKAIDTLRNQLPMFFYLPSLDFSIFGDYILVSDNNQNKITMSKSVYATLIKSIQMAASISKIYPSFNLQKIDYLPELETIQCRVQIVLPDSIRIEGQSIWEGMFYFGVDDRGLINSHIFDRNLPMLRPDTIPTKASYPWLRVDSLWNPRHNPDHPLPGTVFGTSLADKVSSLLMFEQSNYDSNNAAVIETTSEPSSNAC